MKKKDLTYFKKLLTNQLEELLDQAEDTVSGMTRPKENFPDPTDRATLESDRNFMLRIRDREHKLIKKIKKTLDRIEKGLELLLQGTLELKESQQKTDEQILELKEVEEQTFRELEDVGRQLGDLGIVQVKSLRTFSIAIFATFSRKEISSFAQSAGI